MRRWPQVRKEIPATGQTPELERSSRGAVFDGWIRGAALGHWTSVAGLPKCLEQCDNGAMPKLFIMSGRIAANLLTAGTLMLGIAYSQTQQTPPAKAQPAPTAKAHKAPLPRQKLLPPRAYHDEGQVQLRPGNEPGDKPAPAIRSG